MSRKVKGITFKSKAVLKRFVIPPQYDCAYPFENGKAKVSRNCTTVKDGEHSSWSSEAWEFIDKTGKPK